MATPVYALNYSHDYILTSRMILILYWYEISFPADLKKWCFLTIAL